MKQTPTPQDWHDVAGLLGREPIKLPQPITTPVRSCDSLMEAIQRDRDAGLLPPKEENK